MPAHFPSLEHLDPSLIYACAWWGLVKPAAVLNHLFILPFESSKVFSRMVDNVERLYDKGVLYNDEQMTFAHLQDSGLLHRVRLLSRAYLYPEITRDGVEYRTAPESLDNAPFNGCGVICPVDNRTYPVWLPY